ncbi:aldehyde dehydrogenase-like [Amblyomma americanum]
MPAIRDPEVKFVKIFINNEFVNSASGKTFATYNPATGEKIADVQEGDKEDVDRAVKAARAAFALNSPWRTMDASQRGRLLFKLADLMEQNLDLLAIVVWSMSRVQMCAMDIDMARHSTSVVFAGPRVTAPRVVPVSGKAAARMHWDCGCDGNAFAYTRREPVGVVGQIIPWNVPIVMLAWKIGPALAMGNTVVLKPAEQTPLTALLVASYVVQAGFPPGVVNIVPGYGKTAGAAISNHPDVDKVAFTGSTQVGRLVLQASGTFNLKNVFLELGGKSPLIIFPDADLDLAAKMAHDGVFWNQGQVCCAATRTFVHADIYDKFVAKAVELAKNRVVGDPFDERSVQGAQIDGTQMERILGYIKLGQKEGSKLQCGGSRHGTRGYFVQPTVFSDVEDSMTIAKYEIFGPVQSIFKFTNTEEVIRRANDTNYGLVAGIFTNDITIATVVAHALRAGNVWINGYYLMAPQAPFGGYNMSGIGCEMGEDGILEYTEVNTVVTNIPVKNS